MQPYNNIVHLNLSNRIKNEKMAFKTILDS